MTKVLMVLSLFILLAGCGREILAGDSVLQDQIPADCLLNHVAYVGTDCAAYWNAAMSPPLPPVNDLGVQIANVVKNYCPSVVQCHIVIMPYPGPAPKNSKSQYIISPHNELVFINNETVECQASNRIDNTTVSDPMAEISYDGSGTAITMGAIGGRFEGCDLWLGTDVANGILIGTSSGAAYSNYARDIGVRGGGKNTYLVHISGPNPNVLTTEDNHLEKSRISDFVGYGVGIDYANDTYITDVTAYGQAGNTTGITVLIDSQAGGTMLTNVVGGSSGANFLKVRYSGNGYPSWIFARNLQSDLSASDGYVFDSTLGSANIDFTCLDCWAAGAGGAGVHISGGSGIRWIGGKIRSNAKDGITIDGGTYVPNGVFIEHSLIEGNNTSNAGYNGISISGHPNAVSVTGNIIQNYPEVGGFQQYAISTSSDVEGLIFTSNQCSNNVKGCSNLSSVVPSKLTYFGNINTVAGVSDEVNYFPGPVFTLSSTYFGAAVTTVGALGMATELPGSQNASGLLRLRDINKGGTALFLIDPIAGVQLLGTSQITGISSSSVNCTNGNWYVTLSSGTVPRAISWTIYD